MCCEQPPGPFCLTDSKFQVLSHRPHYKSWQISHFALWRFEVWRDQVFVPLSWFQILIGQPFPHRFQVLRDHAFVSSPTFTVRFGETRGLERPAFCPNIHISILDRTAFCPMTHIPSLDRTAFCPMTHISVLDRTTFCPMTHISNLDRTAFCPMNHISSLDRTAFCPMTQISRQSRINDIYLSSVNTGNLDSSQCVFQWWFSTVSCVHFCAYKYNAMQ